MSSISNILVIDDDPQIGDFISAAATNLGMSCTVTTDIQTFLASLTPEVTPENTLIMLDLVMPEMDGIELLRLLGQRQCKVGIILMSGIGKRIVDTAEKLARSLKVPIIGQLPKPFRLMQLEVMLEKCRETAPGMASKIKTKMIIEDAELRMAIERSEFVLHYQPQIEIATSRVVGVEALVRWKHPTRGLIFPDDFITQAETLGLIDEIGWIVANQSLSDISQFADKDSIVPMLSINVSVHSLRDLAFPDTFLALVNRYGVQVENTILEITESGLMKEMSRTLDVLARLRMKKVQLSVDDFGTGFAVMQQLRNIPSTELKIDKSFVQNVHANDSDWVMVQKTIEIGHELGMRVVAEGVETQEQLDFVRAYGCDVVQGYLFSKPLPLAELQVWLANYRATHNH
jgi:EAL domain-containing protein (putative c-di-GMP-specific phosphodiesterase class I)/FixJ family two-component response regulator